MRKFLIIGLFIISLTTTYSQVGFNIEDSPDSSSMLDVEAKNKGILISRVALNGVNDLSTILNPAEGLLVFNTTFHNGGTASTTDDTLANTFYKFSEGRWSKLFENENMMEYVDSKLPRIALLVGVKSKTTSNENTTSFLSGDLGSNIRSFYFDSEISDPLNMFNPTTGEFTASATGLYSININILLRPSKMISGSIALGISNPYTGTFPNAVNNSIFYSRSEIANPSFGSNFPTYLNFKTKIFLDKNQKIKVLTKNITPGNNENQNQYNLNVEAINYKRENTNNLSIIFTPEIL